MERVPALASHLAWYAIDESTVLLVGEGEHYMLSGPAYPLVLGLIDGTCTVARVLERDSSLVPHRIPALVG